MSKKTSLLRLQSLKGRSRFNAEWIGKMDSILARERANGMTGFHLSVDPFVKSTKGQIARSFCKIYESINWEKPTIVMGFDL